MTIRWGSFALGALALFLLAIVAALIVILTGAYNVAATDRHAPLARWALDTTFNNSVERQAADLVAPEFTAADLRAGGREFAEYCVHCHGAPGAKPHEWVSGMTPNPPPLSRAAKTWSVNEIFWIVKHGVKMSGMPPFGPDHDDRTIWNIAAFVDALPGMTPEEYAGYTGQASGGEGGHSHAAGASAHQH